MNSAPNQPGGPRYVLLTHGPYPVLPKNPSRSKPTQPAVFLTRGTQNSKLQVQTGQQLRTVVFPSKLATSATSTPGTNQRLRTLVLPTNVAASTISTPGTSQQLRTLVIPSNLATSSTPGTNQQLRTLVLPSNLATSRTSTPRTNQVLLIANSRASAQNQLSLGSTYFQAGGVSSASSSPIHLAFTNPPIRTAQTPHPNRSLSNTSTTVPAIPRAIFTVLKPGNPVTRKATKPLAIKTYNRATKQKQVQRNQTLPVIRPAPATSSSVSEPIPPFIVSVPGNPVSQSSSPCGSPNPKKIKTINPPVPQTDASDDIAAQENLIDDLNLKVSELEAGLNLKTVAIPYTNEYGETKFRTVLVPYNSHDPVLGPIGNANSKNSKDISVDSSNDKQNSEHSSDAAGDLEDTVEHEEEWVIPHYDLADNMPEEDYQLDPLGDPLAIDVPFEVKAENGGSEAPASTSLIPLEETVSANNCLRIQSSHTLASPEKNDGVDQPAIFSSKGKILREMLRSQKAEMKHELLGENTCTSIMLEDEPDFEASSAKVLVDSDPLCSTSSPILSQSIAGEGSLRKETKKSQKSKKGHPSNTGWEVGRKALTSQLHSEGTNEEEDHAIKLREVIRLRLRGKPLEARTKQVIYNVYTFFETRKLQFNLSYNIQTITSEATGIALRTISKVMADSSLVGSRGAPEFRNPLKKRKTMKKNVPNVMLDSGIRRIAQQSYAQNKSSASLKHIQDQCKKDGLLQGSVHFMNDRLKAMGFQMVACRKRKICVEKPQIVTRRYYFLKEMADFLNDPLLNIVYVLETDLLRMKSKGKPVWSQWDSHEKLHENPYLTTIFHAATINGFIKGALSIMETPIGADNRVTNKHSITWIKDHLLPKVPEDSVVVFGHDRHDEKVDVELRPDHEYSKEQIVDWLQQHGVYDCDASLPKAVLLERSFTSTKVEQSFLIDQFVRMHSCTPLHLPPYHRDLNPLEFIWFNVSNSLFKKEIKDREELAKLVEGKFAEVSHPVFQKAFKQVRKCENIYRENDLAIEEPLNEAIRALGGIKRRDVPRDDYEGSDSEGSGEDLDDEVKAPDMSENNEASSDEEPPEKRKKDATENPRTEGTKKRIKMEANFSDVEDDPDVEKGLVSTDEEY